MLQSSVSRRVQGRKAQAGHDGDAYDQSMFALVCATELIAFLLASFVFVSHPR